MRMIQLLIYILDISMIFISGSLVVDGQFFNLFGTTATSEKKFQTRKREGIFRVPFGTNLAVKSESLSFLLFTRQNRILPEFLTAENAPISEYFSQDKETKIIIHSFMQSALDKIYLEIKDAYLIAKDLNVILVDWPHARAFTYSISAPVTEYVGVETVRLIKALNVPLNKVHIIGFGLGAHSGGIAGAELESEVGRITGLDPSMPLFRMLDDYYKLDEEDGKFVDIIHTDAGDNFWFANHLGLGKPSGSVDFYPNKGIFQPGCLNKSILNYDDMYCSHVRSLELFAESIENPGNLMACKCDNWTSFMGAKCDCTNEENLIAVGEGQGTDVKNVAGKYYLITNERKPFGLGRVGSRSPQENTLQDIMESLDRLSKIINNKNKEGGTRKPITLRSLTDELFTKEEINALHNLKLFHNFTETEDTEHIVLDGKEENKDIVLDENVENYKGNDVILEEEVLEIQTTPVPLDIIQDPEPEHESESENQSDDEYSWEILNEHNENVSDDTEKVGNATLIEGDDIGTQDDSNSNSTKELKESDREMDERKNKLHLLYIIGTLKSGNNVDVKEYRILK